MEYVTLLKPPAFAISKVGDPEQLLQDFTEYVKTFKKFVLATGVGGVHTVDHAACGACTKLKATRVSCMNTWGLWLMRTLLMRQ